MSSDDKPDEKKVGQSSQPNPDKETEETSQIFHLNQHPKQDFFRPGRFNRGSSDLSEGERCPQCSGPVHLRPRHPHPVGTQVLFGLSFLLLLVFFDQVQSPWIIWPWTLFQLALGLQLARARKRAKEQVLHCLRCGADLG